MIPRVTLLVTIAAAAAALFPIACSGSDASPGLSATATLTPPEAGTTDDGGGASANTGPGGGAGTATPARPAQPQTVGSPLSNAWAGKGCYPYTARGARPT